MGEIWRKRWGVRLGEGERQSQHLSWKLMGIVTSCGVEEGGREGDGGVAGESAALLLPRVHSGDRGEMADLVLIMLLMFPFFSCLLLWLLHLTASHSPSCKSNPTSQCCEGKRWAGYLGRGQGLNSYSRTCRAVQISMESRNKCGVSLSCAL